MDSVFARAFKHPIDYCGVVEIHDLPFREHTDLGNNTHSFTFEKPESCNWKAGQHALFILPGKKVIGKKWRAFSVASDPNEDKVMIATTVPPEPSDFKRKLLQLKKGDKIRMFGPYGEFHTRKAAKTMVGVAGGIGITPFRSLLHYLSQQNDNNFSFELIYGGKEGFFAFKDELEKISENPNITIHFKNSPDEINAQLDEAVAKHKNNATYFLSGSPGMTQALHKKLEDNQIKHIINDPFKGY